MDIKENFYSKLQQVREDYDPNDAEMARTFRNQAKGHLNFVANSGDSSRRTKKRRMRDAVQEYGLSQKYAKRAVTGMEEEVDYRKAFSAANAGNENKFHTLMGVTDDMSKNHPTYAKSKEMYTKLRSMPGDSTIADAIKAMKSE